MFSRIPQAALIACIALGVLTGALVASPVASAQEDPTPENTTTTTTTTDDDTRNVTIQVDQSTHIASYEYRNGKFYVTLTTSAPVTRVTLSEAIGGDTGGSGYFNVRSITLTRGEPTRVSVPAEMVDGKAVITLTTSACINSGKCPYIQAGSGNALLFDGAAQWNLVYLAAGVTFIGAAFGTRRYVSSRSTSDDDRIVRGVFDDD